MAVESLSFGARLGLAFAAFFRVLSDGVFAHRVSLARLPAPTPIVVEPEKPQAKLTETDPRAALQLLGLLQRDGRLVDFLMDDIAAFSDAEIGAAARVVHAGCKKVIDARLPLEPVRPEAEGVRVHVAAGYDANALRVVGNVKGEPPYDGTLVHKGWRVRVVELPALHADHDAKVIAPAEIELS